MSIVSFFFFLSPSILESRKRIGYPKRRRSKGTCSSPKTRLVTRTGRRVGPDSTPTVPMLLFLLGTKISRDPGNECPEKSTIKKVEEVLGYTVHVVPQVVTRPVSLITPCVRAGPSRRDFFTKHSHTSFPNEGVRREDPGFRD